MNTVKLAGCHHEVFEQEAVKIQGTDYQYKFMLWYVCHFIDITEGVTLKGP